MAPEINSDTIYVFCLQETKLKGLILISELDKLISLETDSKEGKNVVLGKKWKNNIHNHWVNSHIIHTEQRNNNKCQLISVIYH